MLIVLALIAIALIVVGSIWYIYDECSLGAIIVLITGITSIIIIIVNVCFNIDAILKAKIIDEQISLYQKENDVIEEQIDIVVKNFKDYEQDTFDSKSKPGNSIIAAQLYPELKSNQLIQKQIELYISNHNKIVELENEKIKGKIYRWWLYFGG